MSLRAMVWAFDQKVGSTPAKLVLLKLADHADESGRCFPGIGHLAEHCEMHRSTVMRHIRRLEELGFLNVKRSQYEGTSNTYTLAMNREQSAEGCSREQHPGVAESDRGCRTERQGGVAQSDPNLSVRTSQGTSGGRATRLPDDWCPKLSHYDLAKQLNATAQQVDYEADKFRDHWHAAGGQNARKRDWDRAFNNWLRKSAEHGQRAPTGKPSSGHRQGAGSVVNAYRDLVSGSGG